MKRSARLLIMTVLLAAGALALVGCGYRSGSLIPAHVRTVSLHVVENETFWSEAVRDDNLGVQPAPPIGVRPATTLETELTERIKNELVRRTPLRIADEARADSVLTASVKSVRPRVLIRDAADAVVAERVTIAVDFEWRDRRSGRILASGRGITRPTDFIIPIGESFTTAARRSFDYLAEIIVEQMQEGF